MSPLMALSRRPLRFAAACWKMVDWERFWGGGTTGPSGRQRILADAPGQLPERAAKERYRDLLNILCENAMIERLAWMIHSTWPSGRILHLYTWGSWHLDLLHQYCAAIHPRSCSLTFTIVKRCTSDRRFIFWALLQPRMSRTAST